MTVHRHPRLPPRLPSAAQRAVDSIAVEVVPELVNPRSPEPRERTWPVRPPQFDGSAVGSVLEIGPKPAQRYREGKKVSFMCDYSLYAVQNRLATDGERAGGPSLPKPVSLGLASIGDVARCGECARREIQKGTLWHRIKVLFSGSGRSHSGSRGLHTAGNSDHFEGHPWAHSADTWPAE